MFTNPGKKIKSVAIFFFWLITIASVVAAFILVIESYRPDYVVVIAILVGGPISAYISTLFLVAFGELVENSSKIAAKKESDQIR